MVQSAYLELRKIPFPATEWPPSGNYNDCKMMMVRWFTILTMIKMYEIALSLLNIFEAKENIFPSYRVAAIALLSLFFRTYVLIPVLLIVVFNTVSFKVT